MTNTPLPNMLEKALRLQQNNQINDAMDLFRTILSHDPHQPDALHGLGMAYVQQQQFEKALPYLQQAIRILPSQAEFHNNLANVYKILGKIHQAIQHYHEALRLKSSYPQAHTNLGSLLYNLGQFKDAVEHFEKSLRMDPFSANTHFHLGLTYIQLNQFLEATVHFEEVLKQCPSHPGILHNLGIARCILKRYSDAKPLLEQAVAEEPNNIQALYHLGVTLSALGEMDQAIEIYQKILSVDNHYSQAHHNIAILYLQLNHPPEALTHFQRAFALDPHNKTAEHMIAALSGNTTPEEAPLEYTQALFNQYAFNYDQHVKEQLHYHVPELLRSAMAPFCLAISEPWRVLDIGCGTGLCAPLFVDLASYFVGIDLSDNMLLRAKQRGGYDQLIMTDAIHYLSDQHHQYHLILAADVLIYFGNLEKLFQLIKQALKPKGFFCFSIESLAGEPPLFQLRPTGRYAHHSRYIYTLAHSLGFTIASHSVEKIREQEGIPVQGEIFVLNV